VPAGGYLLVWASDKNMVAQDGQLHTNFKLSASGENITLKKPDGTIVDSVDIIGLGDDQSYGRKSDGASEFVVFINPTPGAANVYNAPGTSTLFINEVMASNTRTIKGRRCG